MIHHASSLGFVTGWPAVCQLARRVHKNNAREVHLQILLSVVVMSKRSRAPMPAAGTHQALDAPSPTRAAIAVDLVADVLPLNGAPADSSNLIYHKYGL